MGCRKGTKVEMSISDGQKAGLTDMKRDRNMKEGYLILWRKYAGDKQKTDHIFG